MKEIILRRGNDVYKFQQDEDGECWIIYEKDLGTLGTYVQYARMVDKSYGNGFYINLLKQGYKKGFAYR